MERQEAVQELLDQIDVMQSARAILSTLPDLERLLSKYVTTIREIIISHEIRHWMRVSIVPTEFTLRETQPE